MSGWRWEWPSPNRVACGKLAEDRATGETFSCGLVPGHDSVCHWQERPIRGRVRSCSWEPLGSITFVGAPAQLAAPNSDGSEARRGVSVEGQG